MTYAMIAELILQVGLPLALHLAENYNKKGVVTPEEIAELKALGAQTPQTQMRDALLRGGIDPASDKGKELLSLVGAPVAVPTPPPPAP